MSPRITRSAVCAVIVVFLLTAVASAAPGARPLGDRVAAMARDLLGARGPASHWASAGGGYAALPPAPVEVRPSNPGAARPRAMYFGARDLPAVTVRAAAAGTVTAEVVDAGGTVVRTLSRSAAGPGAVSLRWDGRVAARPAREGRYTLRAATGSATANASAASPASPVAAPVVVELRDHRFPVDGPHDLGRGPGTTFGGARGHKGQDLFADCGTPVVAAQGGRVRFSGWEGAAGNYVVIHQSGDRQDAVYMHLRHPSRLREGDTVATGGPIGQVGHTGDADGCHLHFELWTAPGWYRGTVYDPLPKLRRWDAGS